MFDIYMYISFAIMAALFLRQLSIYKQPNKINYAPIILGIGIVSAIIHFILLAEEGAFLVVLKGSFIPLIIAILLSLVIYVLHQTQIAQKESFIEEINLALVEELSQMKQFLKSLQNEMIEYASSERTKQEEIREKFQEDLQTLEVILENQNKFMKKFEDMQKWHQELTELFINFTEFKLPELDTIIHKHIDILRVSEAGHYEKLYKLIEDEKLQKEQFVEEIQKLQKVIKYLQTHNEAIAKDIARATTQQLQKITQTFEVEMQSLKSHSESLQIALSEGDGKIADIKRQLQLLMQEIEGVTELMENISKKKELLGEFNLELLPMYEKIHQLQNEYNAAIGSLEEIVEELKSHEAHYLHLLDKKLDVAIEQFDMKMEEYLEQLKEKYLLATDNITDSVKILAKQAQIQKGYLE